MRLRKPDLDEPATGRKHFDLAEANRALPYVRRVVADITSHYGHIVTLRKALEQGLTPPPPPEARADHDAYEHAMDRLASLVDELHRCGVELRDFELGVVAFPARFEGRTILLSWRPTEPAVTHFHEQDESITQRRPVHALAA